MSAVPVQGGLPTHSPEFCPSPKECRQHRVDMRHLPRSTLTGKAMQAPLTRLQRLFEARRSRDAFQAFIERLNTQDATQVHDAADCWPSPCSTHRGAAA